MQIIERKIKDRNVIWLVKAVLKNHKTQVAGKGMPLGNLTSQFFANVYLGELDKFVKHELGVRHYIRYVDDFVILHKDKRVLEQYKLQIDNFLKANLMIELHPEKSRIVALNNGITFLGFRIFYHYKLLKKSNARRVWKRLDMLKERYLRDEITREKARECLEGWLAYAKFANTYKLRTRAQARFGKLFSDVT